MLPVSVGRDRSRLVRAVLEKKPEAGLESRALPPVSRVRKQGDRSLFTDPAKDFGVFFSAPVVDHDDVGKAFGLQPVDSLYQFIIGLVGRYYYRHFSGIE